MIKNVVKYLHCIIRSFSCYARQLWLRVFCINCHSEHQRRIHLLHPEICFQKFHIWKGKHLFWTELCASQLWTANKQRTLAARGNSLSTTYSIVVGLAQNLTPNHKARTDPTVALYCTWLWALQLWVQVQRDYKGRKCRQIDVTTSDITLLPQLFAETIFCDVSDVCRYTLYDINWL